MTEHEVIEGTAVDADEPHTAEIAVRPAATLTVTPQVEAAELVKRLEVIKEAMDKAMVRDVDYGVIPGTDKPALFKPGSEKLAVLFQLDVQIENRKTWTDGGHLTVESIATVYHAPTGTRLGSGEGMCTTFEKKYRYRGGQRTCPACGAATIFRSKFPPREGDYLDASPADPPGWFCWNAKGGCGMNFPYETPAIKDVTERVENPDMADTWNTVIKMSAKRARVDGILNVTGASALFTQDVEDAPADGTNGDTPPPAAPRPAQQQTTTTAPAPAAAAPLPPTVEGAPSNPATKPYNLGGYDGHSLDKIKPLLPNLSDDQLAYLEWYERYAIPAGASAPKARKGVLEAIAGEGRDRARAQLARETSEASTGQPTMAFGGGQEPMQESIERPSGIDWTPMDERPPTHAEYDRAKQLLRDGIQNPDIKGLCEILVESFDEYQRKQSAFVPPASARPALQRVMQGMAMTGDDEQWQEANVIKSAAESFNRPDLVSLEQLSDGELDAIFDFLPEPIKREVRG